MLFRSRTSATGAPSPLSSRRRRRAGLGRDRKAPKWLRPRHRSKLPLRQLKLHRRHQHRRHPQRANRKDGLFPTRSEPRANVRLPPRGPRIRAVSKPRRFALSPSVIPSRKRQAKSHNLVKRNQPLPVRRQRPPLLRLQQPHQLRAIVRRGNRASGAMPDQARREKVVHVRPSREPPLVPLATLTCRARQAARVRSSSRSQPAAVLLRPTLRLSRSRPARYGRSSRANNRKKMTAASAVRAA